MINADVHTKGFAERQWISGNQKRRTTNTKMKQTKLKAATYLMTSLKTLGILSAVALVTVASIPAPRCAGLGDVACGQVGVCIYNCQIVYCTVNENVSARQSGVFTKGACTVQSCKPTGFYSGKSECEDNGTSSCAQAVEVHTVNSDCSITITPAPVTVNAICPVKKTSGVPCLITIPV